MRITLIIALLLSTFSCAPSGRSALGEQPPRQPSLSVEQEEIEVARTALLARSWTGPPTFRSGQVILDRLDWRCASLPDTQLEDLAKRLRKNAGGDQPLAEAVEDFVHKAASDLSSSELVGGIEGLEFISSENLEAFRKPAPAAKGLRQNFWTRFDAAYPKSMGYQSISRVGLSSDRRLAVVAVSSTQGFLMGSGEIEVYELVDGEWVRSTKKLRERWMS